MGTGKYDECFVKEPLGKGGFYPLIITNGARDFGGAEILNSF